MVKKPKKRYCLDGAEINVSLYYDEMAGRYLEKLPDLAQHPVYTTHGWLCVTAVQDACAFAEDNEDSDLPCLDCGSCRFYSPEHPTELIALCRHESNRNTGSALDSKPNKGEKDSKLKEEK